MRKLNKDMGSVINGNLPHKGKPGMVYCKHKETDDKAWDNKGTRIDTKSYGVEQYEKA